jgi:hypothetical protein
MLIKRLSFEEQGRHYGYPACCIRNFSDPTNLKSRQAKYYFVYGFLPCAECYDKLENGVDINNLLRKRKCIEPISSNKAGKLNYSDPVSQFQTFLTELGMLMRKTYRLSQLPYDNVKTWEQIQFLINRKRMPRKKVGENRVMTYHYIKNISKMLLTPK